MTYRRESHTGGGGGIGQPARPTGFQLASRHELVYESMAISTNWAHNVRTSDRLRMPQLAATSTASPCFRCSSTLEPVSEG